MFGNAKFLRISTFFTSILTDAVMLTDTFNCFAIYFIHYYDTGLC